MHAGVFAPEQARVQWRDYGPWTDLYALGCVVWELVCGRPAFAGESSLEIIVQHIEGVWPALTTTMEVPPGLAGWLDRMLALDSRSRFQHAADALAALPAAGDRRARPETGAGDDGAPETADATTAPTLGGWQLVGAPTVPIDALALTVPLDRTPTVPLDLDTGAPLPEPPERAPTTRAPFPTTWRHLEDAPMPAPVVGAGLGLFGLREIPFVDRDGARDEIWRALEEVIDDGVLRLVLLAGGPGVGKSSLANWMATRADEVGAVTKLVATHTQSGSGALEGLIGLWRRAFRTVGLSRNELFEHLAARLSQSTDDAETWHQRARALTEWIEPAPEDADEVHGPRHTFSSMRERYELARRVFRRLAADRPVLVWLDDLQWGRDTLATLEHLLTTREAIPQALVIATVRADILAEDPALAERIGHLCAHSSCRRIDIDPLDAGYHRDLISRMLRLEEPLLDQLAERTEGNPLFATQLLRHLIDRDQLEVGDAGFRLLGQANEAVPEDIFALWSGRIDRLAGSFEDEARQNARDSVELAAALGRQVSLTEWKRVCRLAGFDAPEELAGRMINRGLAEGTDDGFAFAHGLLVDSLAEQARQADRWRQWHRHCAQMLEDKQALTGVSTASRRGQHWMVAEEFERAVEPLLDAIKLLYARSSYGAATELYAAREEALDAAGASTCDPRRVEGRVFLSAVYIATGELHAADELVRQAEACAEATEDAQLRAWIHLRRSELLHLSGRVRSSIAELERARELWPQLNDHFKTIYLRFLGFKHFVIGDLTDSLAVHEQALELAEDTGQPTARIRRSMSLALLSLGRNEEARRQLDLARPQFEADNDLHELGLTYNSLGELARASEHLAEAEDHYMRAFELFEEIGGADLAVIAFNLGMVQFERKDFGSASSYFALVREHSHATGYRFLEYFATCGVLATSAALGDWQRLDDSFETITVRLGDVEQVEPDIPDLLTNAGEVAHASGHSERARRVFELARKQWLTLGEDARADHMEQLLDGLT